MLLGEIVMYYEGDSSLIMCSCLK